ncbi:MAG TPA: hypothetical protein VFE26_04490 [Trebonia sp.]|nr:hypothetical protein [Trebonia sp.]
MQKTMPLPAAKLPVTATAAAVLAAGLALAGCGAAASSSPAGSATSSATAAATDGSAASSTSASSASAATAAGASVSVPFPVAVGNTWNYKITTGGESGTTTNKMTAVTPVAAGQQVTMLTTDHVGSVNGSARETYLFHADGSISYPLGSFSPGSGVTVTSNGVVWPPASVIASGKPSQSTLNISIKAAGQNLSPTAHVTVQGDGTATVTVPAGTYQTTVVLVTERLEIVGITASIQVKTWLAPDVGPVKELVNTNEGSATSVAANEELLSFTKG